MQLRLVTNQMDYESIKRLQEALSEKVGYKVWRARWKNPKRSNILYGYGKNKIEQYEWFKEQAIPALEFTKAYEEAKQWLHEGAVVVARTLIKSSEGKGIVVAETPESLPLAKVYTKYLKKKKEFRVHIFKEQVVCVLEKRRKKGVFAGENKIRNTCNGYVFCRQDVVEPEGIRELALKASKVVLSDFKGVDIGYNELLNKLFVIEVNSAPGMEGTTLQEYVNAIVN